jgi:proteic killer suppression protein
VIRSIKDAETQKIWERQHSKRIPKGLQRIAYRKLVMIHAADNIQDLRSPPGNHLEKLKGDRAGQYSIRINDQWRICFLWRKKDAYNVEIDDYH